MAELRTFDPAQIERATGVAPSVKPGVPQLENFIEPMRVDQVDAALYSPVNQKVQSSVGSTDIAE